MNCSFGVGGVSRNQGKTLAAESRKVIRGFTQHARNISTRPYYDYMMEATKAKLRSGFVFNKKIKIRSIV